MDYDTKQTNASSARVFRMEKMSAAKTMDSIERDEHQKMADVVIGTDGL